MPFIKHKSIENQATGLTMTGVLAIASLACTSFAVNQVWTNNLPLEDRLICLATTVGVVLLSATGFGYLLARELRKTVATPILELTRTVREVSQQQDYEVRANKLAEDEIGTLCDEFNYLLNQVVADRRKLAQSGEAFRDQIEAQSKELLVSQKELTEERNQRQRAEQELDSVRQEFDSARRSAGLAEFAAGVLHNVGNVLNSVNVSATSQSNLLMSSKLSQLERVIELLEKDEDELVDYLCRDEKGKQLPRYMRVLFDHLMEEKQSLFEQSQSLIKNVDHLKSIISTQQSYATSAGLLEPVEIETLFEDAVSLQTESFTRHGIKVVREYAAIPPVLVDKQRVMQIVINLVKNAKEAMHGQKDGTKSVTLRTRIENDRLIMEISDTGMGIEKENLPMMFTHGFTTKASGHGFGLHSCANAASEMEGALTVRSPGPKKGATFTLQLPFKPAAVHA